MRSGRICEWPRIIARLVLAAAFVTAAATGAQAQLVAAPATGITVTGRGAVRVSADELRFVATLYAPAARGAAAASSPPPAVDMDAAAAAVVKALRADGIADAAAGFNLNTGNMQRTVSGTLQKPTRDKVSALLKDGSAAAAPFPSVVLQNLNFSFSVDDCSAPEARAQDAALADAHARAERIAHAGGLRLGAITAVNESAAFNPNAACAIRPDTPPATIGNGRIDADAALTGEVYVSVSAAVTYAIVH